MPCHKFKLPTRPGEQQALASTDITVYGTYLCMPVSLHWKPYKVVTAWRYEGSAAPVPWKALGDMLFEMGACSCSVTVGREDGEKEAAGEESAGEAAAAAATEGREGREAMLTFIVAEGEGEALENVGAALRAAWQLAGGQDDCFGEADD